ncbi:MAG TPA: methionyl-tRNA formyltransferase [Bryobacteraceae bacterium]|nr:methionyl-tRNA formyltransferase [Bryobacteraceae bacterium]
MRLVFLGTPDFAVPTLEKIVEAGHEVAAVFTQPDRPKGRGRQFAAPPVKEAAMRFGLRVEQPDRIRTPEVLELLRGFGAGAMVVVGYGKIVPQTIIDLAPLGIVNVHASLLPKYRGAAPVQWAVANGETRTGVTTMRIDAGLDTGDILLQEETGIGDEETAIEVGARLSQIGAALLVETLERLRTGTAQPRPQEAAAATFAPILKKEDGRIDWTRPAREIHNRARGFLPWPGCHTLLRGRILEVRKTRVTAESFEAPPGTARAERGRLLVSAGAGTTLELVEVQLEGKKQMNAAAFLNGFHLVHNELLGAMNQ